MPVKIECGYHIDEEGNAIVEENPDKVLNYLQKESQRLMENRLKSAVGDMVCEDHPEAISRVMYINSGAYWIREDIHACCLVFYNRLSHALTNAGI